MVGPLPRLMDLLAGRERRRALLDYWRGVGADDWRDLIVMGALRRAPVDLSSAFGGFSGSIRGPKVYAVADATARANLARLRPDIDEAERERMLAARWRCVGRTMTEFSVLDRLFAKRRVQVEGAEHLAAARSGGRGFVVVGLHLGNWEALAVAGRLGFPIASFYEPRPTRARDYISRKCRERLGVRLLAPGPAGVRPALRILGGGGMVMIFGDEEIEGVTRAPLFGRRPHRLSNLVYAARLARKAGAPVVPAFVVRGKGARLRAVFMPPVHLPAEAKGAGSVGRDAAVINAALEPLVLAHLDQWYNLHERLDEPPVEDRVGT